ncbi:hypothetical protein Bbelb_197350 [Branchiostoma belcheri]|nr:hypothetical protein Bbelb_197350 [Branchiostoma belcheri]
MSRLRDYKSYLQSKNRARQTSSGLKLLLASSLKRACHGDLLAVSSETAATWPRRHVERARHSHSHAHHGLNSPHKFSTKARSTPISEQNSVVLRTPSYCSESEQTTCSLVLRLDETRLRLQDAT